MYKYIIISLCFILCSCRNFESARVEFYRPKDLSDENLNGNIKSIEIRRYVNFAKDQQITKDNKIKSGSLQNPFSHKVLKYSTDGILYSRQDYLYNEMNHNIEYDQQGRKTRVFISNISITRYKYRRISKKEEIVFVDKTEIDSEGYRKDIKSNYTIEYDRKGLPIKEYDEAGNIKNDWVIGKWFDNTEMYTEYSNYPKYDYWEVYDKGMLIEEHGEESYLIKTKTKGDMKIVTKVLQSNPSVQVSIEIYKNGVLRSREKFNSDRSSGFLIQYNEHGDDIYSRGEDYYFNTEYEYDPYGNWVVSRTFDKRGDCSSIEIRYIQYYDDSYASNYVNKVIGNYVSGTSAGDLRGIHNTHSSNQYKDPYLSTQSEGSYSYYNNKTLKTKEIRYYEDCHQCGGSGTIQKDNPVATFGLNLPDKWCSICNRYFSASSGHNHITCPTCHGRKKIEKVRYENVYE